MSMYSALKNRLQQMFLRCVLRAIDDERRMQLVEVSTLAGAVRGKAEHFHPYGFSSKPLPGAEGLVGFVGGAQDHPILITVADRRYRLQPLQDGGVALHNQFGDFVVLRPDDREIEVHAGTKVILSSPDVEVQGRFKVTGTSQFDAQIHCDAGVVAAEVTSENADLNMSQVKNHYNIHVHPGGGAPNPQM